MKHIHDMRARMQPLDPAPAASTGHSGPRLDLSHLAALPLRHAADCDLLGAGTDGTLYVEEIIDDGDRVVQHIIGLDGDIRASVDDAAPGVFVPLIALTALVLQIARLAGMLQNEVKPILDDSKETAGIAKGTAQFVGGNVAGPLIRLKAFWAGLVAFMREILGIRRAIKKRDRSASDG